MLYATVASDSYISSFSLIFYTAALDDNDKDIIFVDEVECLIVYKRVDWKVKSVLRVFLKDARVSR